MSNVATLVYIFKMLASLIQLADKYFVTQYTYIIQQILVLIMFDL